MKNKLTALFCSLFIIACLALPTYAIAGDGDSRVRLVDNAGLLNKADALSLTEKLDEISERYQLDVVILTVETTNGRSSRAYADDYYDYNGFGFGKNNDGILLLINMEDRDCYITTSGYGKIAFTDAGIAYIEDKIVQYLSDEDYASAFETFISLADDFITQAKSGEPYDRNNLPREPLSLIWIPLSVGIGFVIALLIVGAMKSKLKTVRSQPAADSYIKRDSLNITESRDLFLYHTVSRTPKPKNTSSGGGSTTHRSSSGSTHGGGGRKF